MDIAVAIIIVGALIVWAIERSRAPSPAEMEHLREGLELEAKIAEGEASAQTFKKVRSQVSRPGSRRAS